MGRRLLNLVFALLFIAALAFTVLWACSRLGPVVYEMNLDLRYASVALDRGEVFVRRDVYHDSPDLPRTRIHPSFFLDVGVTEWEPDARVGPRGDGPARFRHVVDSRIHPPGSSTVSSDVTLRVIPAWLVAMLLGVVPVARGAAWIIARRRGRPRAARSPGRWGRRVAIVSAVVLLLTCTAWAGSYSYRSQWTVRIGGLDLYLDNAAASGIEFRGMWLPPAEERRSRAAISGFVYDYATSGGGPDADPVPAVLSVGGVYLVGSWDALDLLQRMPENRNDRFISGEEWEGLAPAAPTPGVSKQLVGTVIVLRYWLIATVAALWPAVWAWRWLKRKRYGPGACANCGYDLRGTPEQCPECGMTPSPLAGGPLESRAAAVEERT